MGVDEVLRQYLLFQRGDDVLDVGGDRRGAHTKKPEEKKRRFASVFKNVFKALFSARAHEAAE